MDMALPAQSEADETTENAQSNTAGGTKVKTAPSTTSQKLRPQVHLRLQSMNPIPVLFQPLVNMGRHMWYPAVLTCPLHSTAREDCTSPASRFPPITHLATFCTLGLNLSCHLCAQVSMHLFSLSLLPNCPAQHLHLNTQARPGQTGTDTSSSQTGIA